MSGVERVLERTPPTRPSAALVSWIRLPIRVAALGVAFALTAGCSLFLSWDGYSGGDAAARDADANASTDASVDGSAPTEASPGDAGPISCSTTLPCIPPLTGACSPECSACHEEPIGLPICVCSGAAWICTSQDQTCASDAGWYDPRTGAPRPRPMCSFLDR
jgi:hypothetical protein